MDPITGMVEKKAAESLLAYFRGLFTRNRNQKERIRALEAELAEVRSGKIAFARLMSELQCRPEDDHMYWKKDGSGGPYCPLCLHEKEKLIPLTHAREGAFYCRIHEHFFETAELRQRDRQARQDRANAGPPPSRFSRDSWMR